MAVAPDGSEPIAVETSAGFRVARNPADRPDEFERAWLEGWEAGRQAGETPSDVEVVEDGGREPRHQVGDLRGAVSVRVALRGE